MPGSTTKKLNVLAVIPARGGSKSIFQKNIVDLDGKPLIAYTIAAAHCSQMIDDLIVSTDCSHIAAIAREYGADVPFIRPSELSTDAADSLGVVLHALTFMEKKIKTTYDVVIMLQPTTPFRKASWIDHALSRLAETDLDSIVSVVDVGANHPFRMYTINSNQELVSLVDSGMDPMMPRQYLPPVYIRSGDIYATRRSCLLGQKSLIGSRSGGLIIEPELSVNIDEPLDLVIARLMLQQLKNDYDE